MTWGFARFFHWEAVVLTWLGFQFCGGPGCVPVSLGDDRACLRVSKAQAGTPPANYHSQLPGESSNWKPSGRLAWELEGFTGNLHADAAGFQAVHEQLPHLEWEDQHRTIWVLGVPHRYDTRQVGGNFYAVAVLA